MGAVGVRLGVPKALMGVRVVNRDLPYRLGIPQQARMFHYGVL